MVHGHFFRLMRALAVVCLSTAVFSASASAGELRILDRMGLTRAVKMVEGNASVVIISKSAGAPADIQLAHIDGLAPDIDPASNSKGTVTFTQVPEGTWRVKSEDRQLVISEVKIVQ